MFCFDSHLSALKKQGYSIFRLPRDNINPLNILVRNSSSYEIIGDLESLLTSQSSHIPEICRDAVCSVISGTVTRQVDLGLGLHILDDIVAAMGATSASLDMLFSNSQKIAFEFRDVKEDSIDIVKLDQFLASATVVRGSRYVKDILHASEICILTATIKSNQILVSASNLDKSEVSGQISVLQNSIGPKIKVAQESENTVSFAGEKALVFGCKAIQLFYQDGEYSAFRPIPPGMRVFGAGTQSESGKERVIPEYQGGLMLLEF